MDLHFLDIAVVLVLGLLVFGPKRLPELGSQVGRAIREFQHMLRDEQASTPHPVTSPTTVVTAPVVTSPAEAQPTPAVAAEEPATLAPAANTEDSLASEPHQD